MMQRHPTRSALLCSLLLLSLPLAAEEPPAESPADATGEMPLTHERQTLPSPEEQRTAAQALLHTPGERLQLNANGSDFSALFLDSERAARHGGVILLHDNGGHADWPGVIGPLRRGLPALGWATLSLQLPLPPRITLDLPPRSLPTPAVAESETAAEEQTEASTPPAAPEPPATEEEQPPLLEQARPRIATAVEQLRSRGIDNIVLIGHGLGALMAADYLAGNLAAGVSAAVLVGIDAYDGTEPAELIGRIERPLLDLYGTRDLERVVSGAPARAAAASRAEGLTGQQFQQQQRLRTHGKDRSDAIQYRQLAIAGADHGFTGLQPVLLKRVHGWLLRHTGK